MSTKLRLHRGNKKEIEAGLAQLDKYGITFERWLEMCKLGTEAMQRLGANFPICFHGVYDAVSILGFGLSYKDFFPAAEKDTVIIRYNGWSFQALQDNPYCKPLMHLENCDRTSWRDLTMPSGFYRIKLVEMREASDSAGQEPAMPASQRMTPIVLLATAMLAHRLKTGESLVTNRFVRVEETLSGTNHNHLVIEDRSGRISVGSNWCDSMRHVELCASYFEKIHVPILL